MRKKEKKIHPGCAFKVKVNALNTALDRVNSLLRVDGIPIQDQTVAFRTDLYPDYLVIQAGKHGSYVMVKCLAEIETAGYFTTNIAIPWLSYGSEYVRMEYDPENRNVKYKGNIRGTFVTIGDLDAIEIPELTDPSLHIPFGAVHRVVTTALFNANVLEEQEDVLIILEVNTLSSRRKGKLNEQELPRKKSSDKKPATHELRVVVFDRQRAAVVCETCPASEDMPMSSFSSGHLFAFLQKCTGEERTGSIGLRVTPEQILLQTATCISVTPSVENTLGDPTRDFTKEYKDKPPLFTLTLDTEKHMQHFTDVLSVQGGPRTKLSSGSDENAGHVVVTLKKGNVHLQVSGSVAQGSITIKPVSSTGSGEVAVKGTFIVESMSLVHPSKVVYTVWEKMIRQVASGRTHTHHYFGTVDR